MEPTSAIDFEPLKTALTTGITPAEVLAIIAAVIGVGMSFYLMWFGVRKLVKVFTNALSKGKITI